MILMKLLKSLFLLFLNFLINILLLLLLLSPFFFHFILLKKYCWKLLVYLVQIVKKINEISYFASGYWEKSYIINFLVLILFSYPVFDKIVTIRNKLVSFYVISKLIHSFCIRCSHNSKLLASIFNIILIQTLVKVFFIHCNKWEVHIFVSLRFQLDVFFDISDFIMFLKDICEFILIEILISIFLIFIVEVLRFFHNLTNAIIRC